MKSMMDKKSFSGMNSLLWWVVFGLSTYGLSLFFQTFKTFTVTPTDMNGLALLGAIAFLAVTFLVLMFDGYVKEKIKGKIQREFGPFEALYRKLNGDVEGKTTKVEVSRLESAAKGSAMKEVVLLILVFASGLFGMLVMICGEGNINLTLEQMNNAEAVRQMISTGLKPYFLGIGLIFVVTAIAYISLGHEEELATRAPDRQKKS
ncbi:MAG: hypothetical protein KTR14_04620 [Vampirovibrio sp.]|nr:hypothetical protein [Vampirovibrio sp.]